MSRKKVAVITGANRGLGKATAEDLAGKGYKVYLACRTQAKGEPVAEAINKNGGEAVAVELDLSSGASIKACAEKLKAAEPDGIDILVNNAGMIFDSPNTVKVDGDEPDVHYAMVLGAFTNNTLGPFTFIERLIEPLSQNGGGVVVNVSSGMGGITEMGTGYAPYRISKAAMNAMTKIYSNELAGRGIKVNAVCPGWVRTDMGGASATRSLEEGIAGIVQMATIGSDGPTGGFFRDGEPIVW